jgi:hypothetical protein
MMNRPGKVSRISAMIKAPRRLIMDVHHKASSHADETKPFKARNPWSIFEQMENSV